jgi:hypothetical protein
MIRAPAEQTDTILSLTINSQTGINQKSQVPVRKSQIDVLTMVSEFSHFIDHTSNDLQVKRSSVFITENRSAVKHIPQLPPFTSHS